MRPIPDPLADDFLTYRLPLTQGYVALVDWKDRIRIRSLSWRAMPTKSGIVYAGSSGLLLHRWLTNAPDGLHVDHINHDGLDNRMSNLRVVSQSKNSANQRNDGSRNKHGYRGVHFMRGGFYGHITVEKRQFYSKKCATPIEAARAWDELAVKHYGEFVQLNFPAEQRAA